MEHILLGYINQFDLHRIEILLKQNKIDFFIKSSYESSLTAGWINPGSSFNEKMLFVEKKKINEAKNIIKKHIEDCND